MKRGKEFTPFSLFLFVVSEAKRDLFKLSHSIFEETEMCLDVEYTTWKRKKGKNLMKVPSGVRMLTANCPAVFGKLGGAGVTSCSLTRILNSSFWSWRLEALLIIGENQMFDTIFEDNAGLCSFTTS